LVNREQLSDESFLLKISIIERKQMNSLTARILARTKPFPSISNVGITLDKNARFRYGLIEALLDKQRGDMGESLQ
jgi:hypothetical protein